ncbi:MAG: leucine--tRNA ligase [Planctomycetaceae bacterium]|jgi:leucyl-tRNA synthetase|nr:leucine--tRNA ligase [Planctomycetaceae bacterium]
MRYNPAIIEPKWQSYWAKNNTFATPQVPSGKKMYILDMFPYPSGNGLHVGHPEGYTATDIVSRFETMNGTTVLHPMGWDAFGLPAEQQAKKTGIPPRQITETNIDNFRRQLKMLGFSYDWNREIATTDIKYFKWTQYIFLMLYNTWFDHESQKGRPISELPIPPEVADVESYKNEHRLAYQIEAPVNWCPALGTVLSNEEVIQGRSERGNHPVVRMPLRQWMLKITAYADRLENDLEQLDWSESIKTLQKNWIGRSVGAEVDFYIGKLFSVTKNNSNKTDSNSDSKLDSKSESKFSTDEFNTWKKEREQSGFPRKPSDDVLRIYTTRPDTLFGATYMVIAPEHPLVGKLTTDQERQSVEKYCEQAASKSDLDRTDLAKEKTGVFTGSFAINPLTGKPIPIWVADYVLISYGTGAIMAVPAHDSRDFEFAKAFNLPIIQVVQKVAKSDAKSDSSDGGIIVTKNTVELDEAFTGLGVAVNSGQYDGLSTVAFKEKITADLLKSGIGRGAVNYKIRDWLFSRQHFWGEPFPILHELDDAGNLTGKTIPLDVSELPLDIPTGLTFDAKHNSPEPPLERASEDWLYIFRNGKKYKRETNTMPQWAGSCWYYLRYIDPNNDAALIDPALERAWMPVDLYVGGAEHAVLHLLYARFWHKVLFDYGIVSQPEPFKKLVNQGMILGEMEFTGFKNSGGGWISAELVDIDRDGGGALKTDSGVKLQGVKIDNKQVVKRGENFVLVEDERIQVDSRANKMSKSRGNVINPDSIVSDYGADSLRLYEMFMGPLESVKPWSMDGVNGVRGFLDRVWKMIVSISAEESTLDELVQGVEPTEVQNRMLHKTIKIVTEDIRNMSFNTAIARMMEFTNFFLKERIRPKSAMEKFVLILSPFAPHIAEELWSILGHDKTITFEKWPSFDESAIKETTIEIPVSINGKLRSKVVVSADADESTIENIAIADPKINSLIEGKTIVKKIIVRGKMVNLVIKE